MNTLEYSGVLVRGWLELDSSRTLEALEIPYNGSHRPIGLRSFGGLFRLNKNALLVFDLLQGGPNNVVLRIMS